MTENTYIIDIPLGKRVRPWEDQVKAIETILDIDNRLKQKGHKHGAYNGKCILALDEKTDEETAICSVTTYGDLHYLPEEIKPPLKWRHQVGSTNTTKEELEFAKKFLGQI